MGFDIDLIRGGKKEKLKPDDVKEAIRGKQLSVFLWGKKDRLLIN